MQDILDDIAQPIEERKYKYATKGQRFANYLVDVIVCSIFGFVLSDVFGLTFMDSDDPEVILASFSNGLFILEWLFGTIQMLFYYSVLEYYLKGKSLGKFVTNTRAVTIDNEPLEMNDAIIRSLCRLIPFEAFSYLGSGPSGWHDTLSKTKVIQDEGWKDMDEEYI